MSASMIMMSTAVPALAQENVAVDTSDVTEEVGSEANVGSAENVQGNREAVDASSKGEGEKATVKVSNDVNSKTESGKSTGVSASSANGSTTTVEVGGDVTSSAKEADAEGVKASARKDYNSSGEKSTTTVTVGGDVAVENTQGSVTGVIAYADGDSEAAVTVKGGVSAKSDSGKSTGIDTRSSLDSSAYADDTSVKVSADNVYSEGATATGIDSGTLGGWESASHGNTDITVSGDVVAKGQGSYGSAVGVVSGTDPKGDTDINVGGNINAEGSSSATGINIRNSGTGKTAVTVDKDVTATATSSEGWSYGIQGYGIEGDVSVTVGGDVTSNASCSEAIQFEDVMGNLNIDVVGDVIQEGKAGKGILLSDLEAVGYSPVITLKVGGDVTATDTAVELYKNGEESKIDVTVEGTVTGGEHAIVVGEKTTADNLNITVWKVETSNDQPIVETSSWSNEEQNYSTNETTKKIEENINYIIRVDEVKTPGASLTSDKQTAHADEKVYLKLDVPSGYEVDGFYNGEEAAKVSVLQDGSGNYYLEVPRGGGVYVGVNLKKVGGSDSSVDTPSGGSTTPSGGSTYYRDDSSSDSSDSDGGSGSTGSGSAPSAPAAPAGYEAKFSDVTTALAYQGIDAASFFRVSSVDLMGNALSLDIGSVLTPIDNLTAINNFMDSGAPSLGADNIKGAGVVSFANVFANSVSDTVSVPVVSDVVSGFTYTVAFSDGTTISVPCAMNGVLEIPFLKTAEGLTYIIYGVSMDPGLAMQQAMQQTT